MTQRYQRTLPHLTDENRAFWTGGAEGRLAILRCQDCGHWQHPPQPRCASCLSQNVKPEAVSGRGEVFSYTVNMRPWGEGMETPFAIVIVALEEQQGLHLMSKIVGADPWSVHIGMKVRVVFEQDEDVWLPLFTPVG